jgi:hypothetical protein
MDAGRSPANRGDRQQDVDRLPDCAKPRDNGHPHRGETPQQAPPGETAHGKKDAADQNDDRQSSTDIGNGAQHCAIVVLVEKPENHHKPAKGRGLATQIPSTASGPCEIFASAHPVGQP